MNVARQCTIHVYYDDGEDENRFQQKMDRDIRKAKQAKQRG